jgi:hypothetical protein
MRRYTCVTKVRRDRCVKKIRRGGREEDAARVRARTGARDRALGAGPSSAAACRVRSDLLLIRW